VKQVSRLPIAERTKAMVDALDWQALAASLDGEGYATVRALVSPDECESLRTIYDDRSRFRSRVLMARHGFGRGEYKYFAYPLPELVAELRTVLYPHLAAVANRWNEALGVETRYPLEHAAYLRRCHRAGQTKPTPLLLR